MPHIVYASFDQFPAPKGAAVHIDAFVRALGAVYRSVDLVTVASPGQGITPGRPAGPCAYAPGVRHYPLPAIGANLVQRVLNFRTHLAAWWGVRRPDVVHVRSIFEGYPIARAKKQLCRWLVFEVNGLPSIELKYHYPNVADDEELLGKLVRQEQCCLEAADLIITVSRVTAEMLAGRGIRTDRIRVIPNGVDTAVFGFQPAAPWNGDPVRMLYSGTLAAWQGAEVALDALALYSRDFPATLTLVGTGRAAQKKRLVQRSWELGVGEHVVLREPVSQVELARMHHESDVVLAPLLPNDRNLEQGCCPLKVLEAMASGTPLIASDLPVVRDLAEADQDALLVRPGSAKAIKDGMLRLRQEPGLGARLSRTARARVKGAFSWEHQTAALLRAYEEMMGR